MQSFTVTVTNSILDIPSANSANGFRLAQDGQTVTFSALADKYSGDLDADYQKLISVSANTADAQFRIGSLTGTGETLNGVLFSANNLEVDSVKGDRAGDRRVNQIEAHGTTTAFSAQKTLNLTFD